MRYLIPILFALLSANLYAQSDTNEGLTALQFVPTTISFNQSGVSLVFPHQNKTALYWTGSFLRGLKFNNAVDEINALAPFDSRTIESQSFSEYDLSITRYRFFLDIAPNL